MMKQCLHDVSMLSTIVRFAEVAESAKVVDFASGGKLEKADRSSLSLLGILCSILLSYGGTSTKSSL